MAPKQAPSNEDDKPCVNCACACANVITRENLFAQINRRIHAINAKIEKDIANAVHLQLAFLLHSMEKDEEFKRRFNLVACTRKFNMYHQSRFLDEKNETKDDLLLKIEEFMMFGRRMSSFRRFLIHSNSMKKDKKLLDLERFYFAHFLTFFTTIGMTSQKTMIRMRDIELEAARYVSEVAKVNYFDEITKADTIIAARLEHYKKHKIVVNGLDMHSILTVLSYQMNFPELGQMVIISLYDPNKTLIPMERSKEAIFIGKLINCLRSNLKYGDIRFRKC